LPPKVIFIARQTVQFKNVDFEQIINLLRATPLCEGLNEGQLAALAGQLRVRSFMAGETLAASGDPVTEFWVVAEGEIEAYLTDARGRESQLGVVRKGETIGEIAIVERVLRPIRFTTRTHGALLTVSSEIFRDWLDGYPQLMKNLFRSLSVRFRQTIGVAERKLPSPRLGIVVSSPRGRLFVGRLLTRLLEVGERLQVWAENPTQLRDSGAWPESISTASLTPNGQPWLEAPASGIDRRILIWSPSVNAQLDVERLLGCDEVLWLLEPSEAAVTSQDFRIGPGKPSDLLDKMRVVWLLEPTTPIAPLLPDWGWKRAALKAPVEIRGGDLTRLERQGLDRLVRALRGYSVGIALAGGGAKGMAHLGVLRVLEDAGLSFDMMSGTSVGAMAGIVYASGISPERAVECFQKDLTPSRWFRMLPKWPNWYLITKYRRLAWEAMLRRYLYDWRLEQLLIPFHSVTVDLVQVRPVIRSAGDAVHAILESINLPIVSRPIPRDGMMLVDGGILNNLPADVLVEKGADFVVGVDVSNRVRYEFAGNRPDTPPGKMKPAGAMDTLLRIFEAQAHNISTIRNRAVDFWITPDTSGFGLAEFHRTTAIAEVGEVAARHKVPELQQRLKELEQRLLGLPQTS
jgi:NTE family protein